MENKDSVQLTKEFKEKVRPVCEWLKEEFGEKSFKVTIGKKYCQLLSDKLGVLIKIECNEVN